jgi:ketosteroid isomerase-like protein
MATTNRPRDTGRAMSQDTVVRQQLAPVERSNRAPVERLVVRFPWLSDLSWRLVARLSPTSRVRKWILLRGFPLGLAAFNRGDLEVVLLPFRSDTELHPPREWAPAMGFEPTYRGRDGYRQSHAQLLSVWGEFRFQAQELIDLGDRLLLLGHVSMRGQGSGVPLTEEAGILTALGPDGRIVEEHRYTSHAQALEAVGLRE